MKVKRYTGNSLEKIREVIIKELGEKAVIVNVQKRPSKGGKLLNFGKNNGPEFEVVAAVEEAINVDSLNPEQIHQHYNAIEQLIEDQKNQYRGIRQSIKLLDEKLAGVDERIDDFSTAKIPQSTEGTRGELGNIHDEWKSMVIETASQIARSSPPLPEDWHEALASLVPTAGGIMFRRTPSSKPDTYVFIGPTGVGKTTTLAKLAAKCVLIEKLNVGLITLDTFRVAAVDQLREYASLLGIEVSVAFSSKELELQIENFRDKDVVFIDTPGRSQFDSIGINTISESLRGIQGLATILVVPANVRKNDAVTIVDNYGVLNPSALIITKTDEASCCDGLTKLLDHSGIPVVYLTDGQRVPEDIHTASPGIVASIVMPTIQCAEPIKIGDYNNAVKRK